MKWLGVQTCILAFGMDLLSLCCDVRSIRNNRNQMFCANSRPEKSQYVLLASQFAARTTLNGRTFEILPTGHHQVSGPK
jgi:hypothetical protein